MSETTKRCLSDAAWQERSDAIDQVKPRRGRPSFNDRNFLNALRWMLRTGAPWRDLPDSFGPWASVYKRFSRWSKRGWWQALWQAMHRRHHAAEASSSSALVSIDSTSIRVHPHGSPAPKEAVSQHVGVSRGGRTTKLHLACAASSQPMFIIEKAALSPGAMHDVRAAPLLLNAMHRAPSMTVLADKAYDAKWLRHLCDARHIEHVIPHRRQRSFADKVHRKLYRQRQWVERAICRLKPFRRIATRYDRLACHFGGCVQLACLFSLVVTAAVPG